MPVNLPVTSVVYQTCVSRAILVAVRRGYYEYRAVSSVSYETGSEVGADRVRL